MGYHSEMQAPSISLSLHRFDRAAIEAKIEELIAFLDAADGDPDLEPEQDMGIEDQGEGDALYSTLPRYGIDQSAGPINEQEAYRARYREMMAGAR